MLLNELEKVVFFPIFKASSWNIMLLLFLIAVIGVVGFVLFEFLRVFNNDSMSSVFWLF